MAIPEFILKKLIVPGSIKETSNGFQFKILNTFAPAVLSRIKIRTGEKTIPGSDILIFRNDQLMATGLDVNPDRPMALPVGMEFTIESRVPASGAPIYLNAVTREVGEIDFCLSSGVKPTKNRAMKKFIFSYFQPKMKADLSIYPDEIVGKASPFILGQFIEHLERCVYDGIWVSDGSKLRADTLDLIKQINPPLIRYPGGNFASGYHWEDGIGPLENRPARHDAAWHAEESNKVGTDEFLSFCEQIGTEPLLVVNDGSGSPEEAARWVAYCNDPIDSEQGKRRAANGHPHPYNVKYWGVGNEVWGPWQIGTTTSTEYARRAACFIKAMKEVDPLIKIVAVGNSPLNDEPQDEAAIWNNTVLENLSGEIDFLSWHIYQPEKQDWREDYDPQDLYHSVCAAALDMQQIINRVERQLRKFQQQHKILQAVDEWNLWLPPREKNVSMHEVTYTLRDSLYAASVLITFFKSCNTIGMANLAQLVNVLPLIKTDARSAIATAIFYPFVLFNQMHSNLARTFSNCGTFNIKPLSINMTEHTNVPYLDDLATISDDGKSLTLLLVNRYPINRLEVSIHFEGNIPKPKTALKVSSVSPDAFNDFINPNRISISDATIPIERNGTLVLTLKPCSIYLLTFER